MSGLLRGLAAAATVAEEEAVAVVKAGKVVDEVAVAVAEVALDGADVAASRRGDDLALGWNSFSSFLLFLACDTWMDRSIEALTGSDTKGGLN